MQPRSPFVDTFQRLSMQVVENVCSVLPTGDPYCKDGNPLRGVQQTFAAVPRALDQIERDLADLGETILAFAIQRDLTPEAIQRRIDAAVAACSTEIDAASASITAAIASTLKQLRAMSYPAQPQPYDAMRAADIKVDARMVLDGTNDDNLLTALDALLSRALADKDALATWIFASSTWPEDYLRSRSLDPAIVADWANVVADTLNVVTPPNLAAARAAYNVISNPQSGLPVLNVLLIQVVPNILNDVSTWRPSTYSPTPPTADMVA